MRRASLSLKAVCMNVGAAGDHKPMPPVAETAQASRSSSTFGSDLSFHWFTEGFELADLKEAKARQDELA